MSSSGTNARWQLPELYPCRKDRDFVRQVLQLSGCNDVNYSENQIKAILEETMKAIVYTTYGSPDVLQLNDVEKPMPKDNEVLVKVHAASVNPLDWHLRLFLTIRFRLWE